MPRASYVLLLAGGIGLGALGAQSITRVLGSVDESSMAVKKWEKGKGWGWVWGAEDEVGSLNEMNDASRLRALRLARRGQVYDLGVLYSRNSYKWPGHSPGEIMTFRSPEGVKRQQDTPAFVDPSINPAQVAWHSGALFLSDNVATQIDGLGHITAGEDNHWYNGFTEEAWGGNFGIRKCGADTIPPIVARAVLLDIPVMKRLDALPANYPITPADIDATLAKQKIEIEPGDVVLVRTGCLALWGRDGADHPAIAARDSAGLDIAAIRYLVEQKGAMLIASDTSGLECATPTPGSGSPVPGHKYLLVDQGVHIGEFHYLEDLSRDRVYEFCYIATTNKIAGTAAGFCLRPIAIR